jgi:hypothetical protein
VSCSSNKSPCLTWPAHVHLLHVKQAASSIGDTTKQHVLDIYNAPAYRALREKLVTRKDAVPCNKCSFL